MTSAQSVLEAIGCRTGVRFEWIDAPMGGNCFASTGEAMSESSVEILKAHPAALVSAISSKKCPPPSPMGRLRKEMGFYCDIRRIVSSPAAKGPKIDMVFFRECSEDFLPDRNMFMGVGEFMPTEDVALSVRVTTRGKCAQISRDAFEYAERYRRKKVTLVHKSTVFRMNCGMFREEAEKAAAEHPRIAFEGEAPDTLAGLIVMNPERFDVVLAANLFGDILSDVAAAMVGNVMRIANTNGTNAIFYPSHGGMESHACRERISPTAMFRTAADLLLWIGLVDEADILTGAVDGVERTLSLDSLSLSEKITTADVTDLVLASCRG